MKKTAKTTAKTTSKNDSTDILTTRTKDEATTTANLMLCIETDQLFKMYSYRIIDHKNFASRMKEVLKVYDQIIKNAK